MIERTHRSLFVVVWLSLTLAQGDSETEESYSSVDYCEDMCAEFDEDLAAEYGFHYASPVCGADNETYLNECEASFCGDTIAICEGGCPCIDATERCEESSLPMVGHQHGPWGAFGVIYDVTWPDACCDLCEADPDCQGWTWTNIVFALEFSETNSSDCYLFATPNDGETGHWTCFAGNKLPEDYQGADALADYWRDLADSMDVDWTRLGFSESAGQWYLDGQATCVGWGEFHHTCPSTDLVCSGYGGETYGYGRQQMEMLQHMMWLDVARHWMCPTCYLPDPKPHHSWGCVAEYVPVEVSDDFGHHVPNPGEIDPYNPASFYDCQCAMHHLGEYLEQSTYWWDAALAEGLEPYRVSHYDGVWYYDMLYSCVGKGNNDDACDDSSLVCAGSGGVTYGSAEYQMSALAAAADEVSGVHQSCPI